MILIIFQKKNFFFWFLPKNFVQDKWAILGPKMAHPHNSGSALRIFLKFCRMKGANRYMKILLVVFREKNSFGAI